MWDEGQASRGGNDGLRLHDTGRGQVRGLYTRYKRVLYATRDKGEKEET